MRLLRTWLYKIRCVQVCCVLSSETKHYVLNRQRSAATKSISSYLGYKYIMDCQWLVTLPNIPFFFKFPALSEESLRVRPVLSATISWWESIGCSLRVLCPFRMSEDGRKLLPRVKAWVQPKSTHQSNIYHNLVSVASCPRYKCRRVWLDYLRELPSTGGSRHWISSEFWHDSGYSEAFGETESVSTRAFPWEN